VNLNPIFVNVSAGNFKVSSGSGAIGNGVALYQITYDHNDTSRTGAWTIGAYTYP
jgi:hypothetical protein